MLLLLFIGFIYVTVTNNYLRLKFCNELMYSYGNVNLFFKQQLSLNSLSKLITFGS